MTARSREVVGTIGWALFVVACGPSHREVPFWDGAWDLGTDGAGEDVPGDVPGDADGDADGGSDVSTRQAVFMYPGLAPTERWCTAPVDQATAPGLFVHEGRLFAFHNALVPPPEGNRRLMLRTADLATLTIGAAVPLPVDAYSTDLSGSGDDLQLLAAGRLFSSYLLRSPDAGATWTVEHVFTSGTNSGSCRYKVPCAFVRPPGEHRRVLIGFDYDTRLFGCTAQTHAAFLDAGTWTEPVRIADGAPAGAFATSAGIVAASSGQVVLSTDDGATFAVVPGGETTAGRLAGESLAQTSDGTLWLAQTYGYALRQVVMLLVSRDGGATWPERLVLADEPETDAYFFGPTVTATGLQLVVAWRRGAADDILGGTRRCSAWVTQSSDAGETWSIPFPIADAALDETVTTVVVATDGRTDGGGWTFAAYAVTGEGIEWDFRRVCVTPLLMGLAP